MTNKLGGSFNTVRISLGLAILSAIAFFALSHFDKSHFVVENVSPSNVIVVAKWREEELVLGNIGVKEKIEFKLYAEASMVFIATYPNGSTISSEPIYFTSGTDVEATIFSDKINTGYASGT